MIVLLISMLLVFAVHTAHAFGVIPVSGGMANKSLLLPPVSHYALHRSGLHRPLPRLPVHLFEKMADEDLGLKKIKVGDQDFWTRQKELINEMQDESEKRVKANQREKFAQRRLALVGDTAYFGFFIFCALWTFFENPFVAISYSFGAFMGTLYAYGLGKYVETLGGSADDSDTMQGAGVGEARFAFLILLFVIVGKFRSQGLLEIPSIAGFFTYQIASLSQGLREIND